jgi:hypothetical protein
VARLFFSERLIRRCLVGLALLIVKSAVLVGRLVRADALVDRAALLFFEAGDHSPLLGVWVLYEPVDLAPLMSLWQMFSDRKTFRRDEE